MRHPDPSFRSHIHVSPQPEPEEYPRFQLLLASVIFFSISAAVAVQMYAP
jgi:hypothetical protein